MINLLQLPAFASLSATSFPSMLQWEGIHDYNNSLLSEEPRSLISEANICNVSIECPPPRFRCQRIILKIFCHKSRLKNTLMCSLTNMASVFVSSVGVVDVLECEMYK